MKKTRKSSYRRATTECDLSDARFGEIKGLKVCATTAGAYKWERGDCSVTALAIGADIPYSLAHEILKRYGRKDRGCCPGWQTFIQESPFRWRRFVRKPLRLRNFVKKYPKGRFIVCVRPRHYTCHVFNVIDGCVYDSRYDPPNAIIHYAWSILGIKKGAAVFDSITP